MESIMNFNYRQQQYSASYVICEKEYPTYIYVTFKDESLVKEFGEEIVIHCNGDNMLTDIIYTDHRLELYKVIFKAISAVEVLHENAQTSKQE